MLTAVSVTFGVAAGDIASTLTGAHGALVSMTMHGLLSPVILSQCNPQRNCQIFMPAVFQATSP